MGPRSQSARGAAHVAQKIRRQLAAGPDAKAHLDRLLEQQQQTQELIRTTQEARSAAVARQVELVARRDAAVERGAALVDQSQGAVEAESAAARSLAIAQKELRQLDKRGFSEMKTMKHLPQAVQTALAAMCTLLGEKPKRGRLLLASPGALVAQLLALDVRSIPRSRLGKAHSTLLQADLTVEKMAKASRSGVPLVRWLWGVFEWSAASSRQTLAHRARDNAQMLFDENAGALEDLELQLQTVQDQLVVLQGRAVQQEAAAQETAAAVSVTEERREAAAQQMAVVNWAQELCDAVRRHDHPSLCAMLENLATEDIAGMFYRGATPLHTAAIHDNHAAAAALLDHGGPGLLLRSWWDGASMYRQICRRTSKALSAAGSASPGATGAAEHTTNTIPAVTLTQVRLLARDACVSAEACAQLELLQPGGEEALQMLFDAGAGDGAYAAAAAAAAAGTETVVSECWFARWWSKARPTESPLVLACTNGWSKTAAVILQAMEQQQHASATGTTAATTLHDISTHVWGKEGKKAFHLGVCRGQTDVVEALGRASFFFAERPDRRREPISRDPATLDARGYSAVWNAVRRGDMAMVRTLTELGFDLRDGGPGAPAGQRPLHAAARMGHLPLVEALLKHVPARVSWEDRDANGATALHTAARHGQLQVLRRYYLPNPLSSSTVAPMSTAAARTTRSGAAAGVGGRRATPTPPLQQQGQMVGSQDPVDRFGRTALDVAVVAATLGSVVELMRIRHVCNVTAELKQAEALPGWDARFFKGAGVSTEKWTLLHMAASQGLPRVAKLALSQPEFAADAGKIDSLAPDPFSAHSWTPLMLAAGSSAGAGAEKTVALLCEAKAALDVRNENQWNAIWMAANSGNSGAVAQLLQAGADPWTVDLDGVDAMMAAALGGNTQTIRLLLEHYEKAPKKARQRVSSATLSTVLIAGLMQTEQASDLVARTLDLGVRADVLDVYGRSAMQHALSSDRPHSHELYAQLARAGGSWLQRVRVGQSTLALLDWHVDRMNTRADSTQLALGIGRLSRQLHREHASSGSSSVGPSWIKNAVEGVHKLAQRGGGELESGSGTNYDETTYTFAEVSSCMAKARSTLVAQMGERENRLEVLGLEAYKLSLHWYILEMDAGAQWVLWKYPTLAKQSASQVDPLQRTPLMVACFRQRIDWLDILLGLSIQSIGARKRVLDAADIHGRTALHYCVLSSSKACLAQVLALRPQLLERETKPHAPARPQTAHEMAQQLRQQAERDLAKVKYTHWARATPGSGSCRSDGPRQLKLIVTVDIETLKSLEAKLRACKEVERHLRQAGARGPCAMRCLRLVRWLVFASVALPIACTAGLLSVGVFTLTARSSRLVNAPLLAHKMVAAPHRSCLVAGLIIGSVCATAYGVLGGDTDAEQRASDRRWLGSPVDSGTASLALIAVTIAMQLAVTAHTLLLHRPQSSPRGTGKTARYLRGGQRAGAAAQQQTVNLFQGGGCGLRSGTLLVLTLLELPQLLGLGGGRSGSGNSWFAVHMFQAFLANPAAFACHDRPQCDAELSSRVLAATAANTSSIAAGNGASAIDQRLVAQVQEAVCSLFPDGACDTMCGHCEVPATALWAFSSAGAAMAGVWVLCAGTVLVSVGLAGGTLPVRRWLPALRADTWHLPGHAFWETVFCHALYMPVLSACLNLLDCRVHEYTDRTLILPVSVQGANTSISGNVSSALSRSSGSIAGNGTSAEGSSVAAIWAMGGGLQDRGWMWPTATLLHPDPADRARSGDDATDWVLASDGALISLANDLETECWVGLHGTVAPLAMLLLLLYQIASGVLPLLLPQSISYGVPAVVVPPTFDAVTRTVKLLTLVLLLVTSEWPVVASTIALCGQGALVLICAVTSASEHRWLHRLRLAIYLSASFASATQLASLVLCDGEPMGGREGQWNAAAEQEGTRCAGIAALAWVCGLLLSFVATYRFALESTSGRPPWISPAQVVRKWRTTAGSAATVTPVAARTRTTSHAEPEPSLEELLLRVEKILARSESEAELALGGVTNHEVMEALYASEGHVGAAIKSLQLERAAARAKAAPPRSAAEAQIGGLHGGGVGDGKAQADGTEAAAAAAAAAAEAAAATAAQMVEQRIAADIQRLILTDGYELLATRSQRQERNQRRPRSLPPLNVPPPRMA